MTEYNINDKVDTLLGGRPEALQKVKDNRKFIKNIQDKKIPEDKANIKVFGVKNVNVNAILKDNIWNRSIFTTDKLCRQFLGMNLEQLKKYEKKKRHVSLNMLWIVMIMFGVIVAILVVIFLLPRIGVMI